MKIGTGNDHAARATRLTRVAACGPIGHHEEVARDFAPLDLLYLYRDQVLSILTRHGIAPRESAGLSRVELTFHPRSRLRSSSMSRMPGHGRRLICTESPTKLRV